MASESYGRREGSVMRPSWNSTRPDFPVCYPRVRAHRVEPTPEVRPENTAEVPIRAAREAVTA